MSDNKVFYLDMDGKYRNMDDGEELTIIELEHSAYGHIEYIVYNSINQVILWHPSEEYQMLPDDWEDEI